MVDLLLPRAKRIITGKYNVLAFELPTSAILQARDMVSEGIEKWQDCYDVRVGLPKEARSTGFRSQNSHTHGHYSDIAFQLSTPKVSYLPDDIGRALKIMAVQDGFWPYKKDKDKNPVLNPITKAFEPISESESSTDESAKLIEFIHWWADTNGLWLTEYVNGSPSKIYGGTGTSGA